VSPGKRRKQTWLLIGVVFVAAAASPFVMPYTGVKLPFAQEVVTSIITFAICVCIILFVRRYRGKV
jgi:hydrogenase/urease accessory protein HupE